MSQGVSVPFLPTLAYVEESGSLLDLATLGLALPARQPYTYLEPDSL